MYFPATIWFTILAGIIEKQGPTTNGCFKIGLLAMLEIVEPSLAQRHNDWDQRTNCGGKTLLRPIAKCGRENVGTKEGTTEIGLPCVAEGTGPKSWSDMIGSLSYMYV